MIKIIVIIARKLSYNLNRMLSWLESRGRSADIQAKFVDLAPTDEADKAGVYSEAILFATSNAKVFNIALTGPYGSGKSSIIQTFLKKYPRPALHISLAAFIPETGSEGAGMSRQEIERSILQQMLYGADANKLPLSRFKRIRSPGVWSTVKSLFITLGILALWYVFSQQVEVMSGDFLTPFALSNGVNLGISAVAAAFLWTALHHLYVASFGLSLKSISLKDVEIRPAHEDQTSVLNRHLDEIIYFFQSTDYDLVVIEDLDRFNDADIFVTLRELNSLVNENAGVKRPIRFLYALRDDMFVNTDRTKFFEFIIPVIPIINSSNSIDMLLRQGRRLAIDGRLDRQFLREVSRYLNDLRLIQNIFNEYAIYVAHLETDGESLLDASKLLAILIYKNVYPRDFEQLHRGTGNLAEILNRQDKLIREGEAEYRAEIADLERRLEVAERQTPTNLKELRQIYAMALVEALPLDVTRVGLNQQSLIAAQELVGHDAFEKLIGGSHLYIRYGKGYVQQFDISNLQSEVDPQKSYLQRKKEIESKTDEAKSKVLHRMQDLRSKISKLRTTKLNELLRLNADRVEDVFEAFGENGELARFLILEGHLDDTYYQYISLFHSGRLSPNDNRFLIQIRAFITPEPNFLIDNPKEVIAAMRDEDFRQSYALNVKIVDSLLNDQGNYPDQTRRLFELLSSEFESSEEFLEAYYTGGRDVAGLLAGLVRTWKNLVPAAIASANSISHVTQLVANLPLSTLKALAADSSSDLSRFVAANLPGILVKFPELAPERLGCLDFEVEDLAAIKEHPAIVRFMFEESRFQLTISNLEFAYQSILGESDLEPLRDRNFTTIRSTHSAPLLRRVERGFDHYLCNILLALQENSKEDEAAILAVVCHETLNPDDLRNFLERQTTVLSNLEDVPEKWHTMLFESNMIQPTWANCLAFMRSDGFDAASLIEYLDRDFARSVILQYAMPGDPDSLQLRNFIVEASALSDVAYREYVRALPSPFKNPPQELGATKLRILINERKITFTKESLDQLADDTSLQVLFVAANIDAYLAAPANFALDDDFREELLRSEISQPAKLEIVKLMDLGTLLGLPERSALIGPILDSPDVGISNLNGSIAQSLITNAAPIATQISLFNKFHSLMSDDDVRLVLDSLPEPYSEIKTGYRTPRLKKNPKNLDLVKWLDTRDFISSWSEGDIFSDDIRVNLYRG